MDGRIVVGMVLVTAPSWLSEHLRDHSWNTRKERCACGERWDALPIYEKTDMHRHHVAESLWAEIERRMDESGRTPNDPVYGLVAYEDDEPAPNLNCRVCLGYTHPLDIHADGCPNAPARDFG